MLEFKVMPFGVCNGPATFQHCMLSIFSNIVEKTIEIFMDAFSILGDSFGCCLAHLYNSLQRREECNLLLN